MLSSLTTYQSAVASESAGESSGRLIRRPALPRYHFVALGGFLVPLFFLCWTHDGEQLCAKNCSFEDIQCAFKNKLDLFFVYLELTECLK